MGEKVLDIEARWPELFEGLDEVQRRSVVQPLTSAWHEGWQPNRADVADLADLARDAITREEYDRRSVVRAEASRGEDVAAAVHSVQMEGLDVTPATRADAGAFVAGRITSHELVDRVRARYGLG